MVPYAIDGTMASCGEVTGLVSAHMPGLDLYLDPSLLDEAAATRTRSLLERAIATLDAERGWRREVSLRASSRSPAVSRAAQDRSELAIRAAVWKGPQRDRPLAPPL